MSSSSSSAIYAGRNPDEIPAYSLKEAARFLQLPEATVRSWVLGRRYTTQAGERAFQPLIVPADRRKLLLSFRDLVELHVLAAVRRKHRVRMPAVRKAIRYLQAQFETDHPLSSRNMLTDGKDLFIERYGNLVSVSAEGQMALKKILEAYLQRIERNPRGAPIRLYPFTRSSIEGTPRSVVIDPRVQFGRPCVAGTGVPTEMVMERYKAGDSIQTLANDYGCAADGIEEAIRYETAA